MDTSTLALSAELRAELEEVSRETGRPQTDLVVDAIEAYLQRYRRSRFLTIGAGHSKEVTGKNSEDWLFAHWKVD
jgi:predicted transcriptional regulator